MAKPAGVRAFMLESMKIQLREEKRIRDKRNGIEEGGE